MNLLVCTYVEGFDQALEFYKSAFEAHLDDKWKNADGTYGFYELILNNGVRFALGAREGKWAIEGETNSGNTMQICLLYKEGDIAKLEKAYNILRVGAQILYPLGRAEHTDHTCDLVDKFGLRWCLMV
ncbi:MAG: VOC family protein [Firmicutes bacterium]|nr:VOC family protein [Bacillota bacterium]